jgi:hypothetical protein
MTAPDDSQAGDPQSHRKRGSTDKTAFEAGAEKAGRSGPLAEFSYFLKRSRKWWMTPIIAMLLLIGTLLVMAGTSVGPMIYALF